MDWRKGTLLITLDSRLVDRLRSSLHTNRWTNPIANYRRFCCFLLYVKSRFPLSSALGKSTSKEGRKSSVRSIWTLSICCCEHTLCIGRDWLWVSYFLFRSGSRKAQSHLLEQLGLLLSLLELLSCLLIDWLANHSGLMLLSLPSTLFQKSLIDNKNLAPPGRNQWVTRHWKAPKALDIEWDLRSHEGPQSTFLSDPLC